MSIVRASLKLFIFGLLLFVGMITVLLASLLSGRRPEAQFPGQVVVWLARSALRLFKVTVSCNRPDAIQRHQGLLFANHVSYLDIPILLAYCPLRFLAKAEVRRYPLIGQIARAIGTVFVQRSNKQSRRQARAHLKDIDMTTPLVIFVEGKTGPGGVLLPFRYGAFDIAILTGSAFLPCAIIYEEEQLVVRRQGETLLGSIWRLACCKDGASAHLEVLEPVQTRPDDDARLLSLEAHAAMARKLPYPPSSSGQEST